MRFVDDVALVRLTRFEVTDKIGNAREADTLLESEVRQPNSLYMSHIAWIERLERRDPKLALAAAEGTQKSFRNPNELLPILIRLNMRTGNKAAVSILQIQCIAVADPELSDECTPAGK